MGFKAVPWALNAVVASTLLSCPAFAARPCPERSEKFQQKKGEAKKIERKRKYRRAKNGIFSLMELQVQM